MSDDENGKPTYQAPKVIPLGELAKGEGQASCRDGSIASSCNLGTSAANNCHNGGVPAGSCNSGTLAIGRKCLCYGLQ